MAANLIDRPLTFAIPQVGYSALLPQQAALHTEARIYRLNDKTFIVSAKTLGAKPGSGRSCRVQWSDQADGVGGWMIQHAVGTVYDRPKMRFNQDHLRAALTFAVKDTTVEFIIDRDRLRERMTGAE